MEKCSPNILAARPQSSQEHDFSLGSFPTDPTHFDQHSLPLRRVQDTEADPSLIVTTTIRSAQVHNSSVYPSPSQQAALAALREFDNQIVLAWLTGIRSFKSDRNHWFQPESLSSRHFDAISVLKDCPDSLLCAWLDSTRAGGPYPLLRSVKNIS